MAPKDGKKGQRKKKDGKCSYYRGPTSALVDALLPEIKETGFVQYHETPVGTKLDKRAIQRQGNLIRAMHSVFPNLSFVQSQLEDALAEVAAVKQWFINQPSVKKEWKQVQGKRLRSMARHFTQALKKVRGSSVSWVRLVLTVRPSHMCCQHQSAHVQTSGSCRCCSHGSCLVPVAWPKLTILSDGDLTHRSACLLRCQHPAWSDEHQCLLSVQLCNLVM